ncbi:MAG: ABC transporter ATP-binding protein [Beijerinckiaceae bacterium]
MNAPFLSFRDVSVTLGGREIVQRATAHFAGAGLVALVGPNGAGKTTLIKALVGLLPSSGVIEIENVAAQHLTARERALRVGYLPQGQPIHWPLPAQDIVALGRYAHGAHDPSRLSDKDRKAVERAMASADAATFTGRRVTELSGGERARVALARVLATEAPIIFADEPIASLDPRHQLTVMALMKRLADQGRLVVVVLHDLRLAWRYADRAIVIHDGRIIADGPPQEALAPQVLDEAFGVSAAILSHEGRSHFTMLEPI